MLAAARYLVTRRIEVFFSLSTLSRYPWGLLQTGVLARNTATRGRDLFVFQGLVAIMVPLFLRGAGSVSRAVGTIFAIISCK